MADQPDVLEFEEARPKAKADVDLLTFEDAEPKTSTEIPRLSFPPGISPPPNESQLPFGFGPAGRLSDTWQSIFARIEPTQWVDPQSKLGRAIHVAGALGKAVSAGQEAALKKEPPGGYKTAEQVLKGVSATAEDFEKSFESPFGAALSAGGGALPAWFHKLVGAGFSLDAIRNAWNSAPRIKAAIDSKDPEAIAKESSGLAANLLMAGIGAAPLLRRAPPGKITLPARARQIGGKPNAQQTEIQTPNQVPAQPGQPVVRPTEKQAQGGTAQRGGASEETKGIEPKVGDRIPREEVLLSKPPDNSNAINFLSKLPTGTQVRRWDDSIFEKQSDGSWVHNPSLDAEGNTLSYQGVSKDGGILQGGKIFKIGKAGDPLLRAREVAAHPLEKAFPSGFSNEAIKFGAGLDPKRPQDLAELRKLEAKAIEELNSIPKDMEHLQQITVAGSKKQWLTEAIEAATGKKTEFIKQLIPDYKAPFPETQPEPPPQLRPAISVAGKLFTGQDHVDAYENAKRNGQPDTSGAQEGFVDQNGKFLTREQAAQLTGLPTGTEPGKLHSSDLPAAKLGKTPAPHNIIAAMEMNNIRIRNKKASVRGEEDFYAGSGYANANRGAGAGRFATDGMSPDRALQALKDAGEISQDATVEDMWNQMDKANQMIRAHNKGETPEAIQEKFFNDVATEGKPKKTKERTNTNLLAMGNSFQVNGVEWEVTHLDPDSGEIQVRNDKGHIVTLPDGMAMAIDRGSLMAPLMAPATMNEGQFGPGAAQATGATIPPAGAVGSVYSNIAPLDELAQAVRRFPRQKGTFADKMRQWLDSVGIPIKDKATRAWASIRGIPAWIKTQATTLPTVDNLDRRVGVWNGQDWTGSQAARHFSQAVSAIFKDRSKLRALSNWVNAGGDKAVLARQAALTKDPVLRKTYEDALKFGPDEERLAAEVRQYHDEMLAWAQREGALADGVENYLHRYFRPDDPALQRKLAAVQYLRFSKDFSGFRQRYYESDFEAEQAGLRPEKDAAKRILAYDYGFRQALTAREFVRKSFESSATAKDGRPELDVVGGGFKIPGSEGPPQVKPVTLIKPKWRQDTGDPVDYRGDYVRFEHPAFKKWHFASTDSAGNPILVDGDILVHPDFAKKYQALFERSWWGKTPFRRGVLALSTFAKQTMLQGPFHLVQITTGGIEHRINPFKLVELEPHNPDHIRMAEAGLFAGDQGSRYMSEGVSGGGLLDKLPVFGEYLQAGKDWLFNDYIPRWKMTLALEAEKRNMARYASDIRAGKITPEQVTRLSARQAAAVFGGQNMRAIYRSKTFQDTLRFLFLAPDFGEERLRQVFQAGGKYGHEQRMALLVGGMGLAVIAKSVEKALTGKMDLSPKHIFSVTYNGKEYSLRNPAADIAHFVTDPIGYLRNRLNAIYTRPLLELTTGRDAFGRKRSYGQQLTDEIKQIVPIPLRGLVEKEQSVTESLLNSTGLTEHRRSDFTDVMKKINEWKAKRGYTEPGEFVYDPDKDPYHPLTSALSTGSKSQIQKRLTEYLAGKPPPEKAKIFKHYARSLLPNRPFTGSRAHEREYLNSLTENERADYARAREERLQMWQKFLSAWRLQDQIQQQ
jgi:hypothetical protein